MAAVAALLPVSPSRVCRKNVSSRLGFTGFQAYCFTVAVYWNYVLYGVECLILWPLGAIFVSNRRTFQEFLDVVLYDNDAAQAADRRDAAPRVAVGAVFIGGHYGVIEQTASEIALYLQERGRGHLWALAKPSPVDLLTRLIELYRQARGINVLWTRRQLQTFREISACLKRGDSIALVNDQKPAQGGVFVDFLGAPSAFPYVGLDFVQRLGTRCVACNTRRLWLPGLMRIEFAEMPHGGNLTRQIRLSSLPFQPSSSHVEEGFEQPAPLATVRILESFAGWLGELVRVSPYQWAWDYRKWSRKPGTASASNQDVRP